MTNEVLQLFYTRKESEVLSDPDLPKAHESLLQHLEDGSLRCATPVDADSWMVETWVKSAILIGFKSSSNIEMPGWPSGGIDKSAFPPRRIELADCIRIVPGGSSLRRGSHIDKGVIILPPSYINVGAWVGANTMIDSHVLVGSCAQIGNRVHLSAGVQIGGVLEPAGSRPVIIEDDCFIGALSGIFEGVHLRNRVVLAPNVILSAATWIYDVVNNKKYVGEVPTAAVVVPGSRAVRGSWAESQGLSLYAPCIVKYRDSKTDASTALEGALR